MEGLVCDVKTDPRYLEIAIQAQVGWGIAKNAMHSGELVNSITLYDHAVESSQPCFWEHWACAVLHVYTFGNAWAFLLVIFEQIEFSFINCKY